MIRGHGCIELAETNPFYYPYVSFGLQMKTRHVDENWINLKKIIITNLTIDWRQFKGQQESVSFSLPWTKSLFLFFLPWKPRALPFLPLPWPAIFSQFTAAAKGKSEEGEKRREKEEKTRKGEGCTNPRPLGGSRGDSFDLIPLIWMRSRVCNDPFTLD